MIVSQEQLAKIFLHVSKSIEAGDSFDGNLSYEAIDAHTFEVYGAYRIGNLDGQGGMRILEPSKTTISLETA